MSIETNDALCGRNGFALHDQTMTEDANMAAKGA
jgi:hypothetical protein